MRSAERQGVVSVILTSYNHERFLRQAIESALAQTYAERELIVIDDASDDGSQQIAKQYEGQARLILRTDNVGTYPALNEAIDVATGEWIAILNSDDYWMPTKLEAQMRLDERYAFRFCNGHVVDGDDAPAEYHTFGSRLLRVESGPILERLIHHNHCFPSTVLFRKQLWTDVGGFNPEFVCVGDWECFLRMAECTEFGFVDEDLVAYRVHGAQTSLRVGTMNAEEVRIREGILRSEGRYASLGVGRAALAHSAAALGTQYHLLGRAAEARRMYLHSLRLNPLRFKSALRFALACLRGRIERA